MRLLPYPRGRDRDPGPDPGGRPGRGVVVASVIHTAAVLLALALIRLTGERWWAGIALIFMPRVLWLAPTVVLAVAAARTRRRLWGLQALTALVVLGPLMGLSLPWRTLGSRSGGFGRLRLRIMTFNRGWPRSIPPGSSG